LEEGGMKNDLPNSVVYLFLVVLSLLAACALWLLIREVLRPPRRIRAGLIVTLLFVTVLLALQLTTGYYFVFTAAEAFARLSVLFVYLLTMVLVLTGKRMAWRLNRIVGALGVVLPPLFVICWPRVLVLGVILVFGFFDTNPVFQGKVAPGFTYGIAINRTLIGNGSFYRYSIYRNPRWLPVVRKKMLEGPVEICDDPAFALGVSQGLHNGSWDVWCKQTPDAMARAEVSAANEIAGPMMAPQQ
jgi:hypothetical protein